MWQLSLCGNGGAHRLSQCNVFGASVWQASNDVAQLGNLAAIMAAAHAFKRMLRRNSCRIAASWRNSTA